MGGRATARSRYLARAATFIAVASLGFATVTPAVAAAHPDKKPNPSKTATQVLTSAPALAERPPETPHIPVTQTTAATVPVSGPSAPEKSKAPIDPYATTRAAQAAASVKAKNSGHAVNVPELTTERSTTTANPDGTFTASTTFAPQRAKVNGAWVPIDTTLTKNADGSWMPMAAVAGITLSDGGAGPLASVRIGAKTITMSWPLGALPTPQVTGNHAVYPQVLPGVDLRVSADAEGIREVLVVADRNAASNPALKSLAVGLSANGVTLAQAGDGITATDAATGRQVFTSPAPAMWDSTGTSTPASALTAAVAAPDSADSPSVDAHVTSLPVHLQGSTAIVTPSQAMIADAHTTYPLFIDPPVSIGTYHYGEIYSNAGMTTTPHFDSTVAPGGNGTIVRAGYNPTSGGGYIRGMFSFDVGDAMMGQESGLSNPNGGGLPEDGSNITGASMTLTSDSNPCNNGANISVEVDGVNRMDPSYPPTWAQDGPGGAGHTNNGIPYAPVWGATTKMFSGLPSGCGGAGNTINISDNTGGPLTNMVTNVWRYWTSHNDRPWCPCNGDGTATFGVKWTNEVASGQYGSWEVAGAGAGVTLRITYVSAPVINQTPTVTPGNSGTAIDSHCGEDDAMPNTGPGTYIPKNISDSVTLNASFFDLTGGEKIQTQYKFEDQNDSSGDRYYPGPGSGDYYPSVDSVAGGQLAFKSQTITATSGVLREGHTYKFYPRAVDAFDSIWLDSSIYGFSTSCRFTIAFKPPNPPQLAPGGAPDLPALGSATPPRTQMVAAQAVPSGITIQDSTDGVAIDHFDYAFNGDSSKVPQNAVGCTSSAAGCRAVTSSATGDGLAGFTATTIIPVPAGVTTMGDNSLWVQAVDVAGNRSGVFQYQFYLPGNPNATPTLGDVTGNGYPSIVIAAPDPNNTGVQRLVAFPGNVDPDVIGSVNNGVEVAPAAAAPDGQSWANTLITHRGADRGVPVDDLFAYNTNIHALYYYLNSAVFGSPVPKDAFTGGSPTGGAHRVVVTRPACVPAPANYNCVGYAPNWSDVIQILSLGNAAGGAPGTFSGRTNLITVESDHNHGARVWMFSPTAPGQLTNPILLSYDTTRFNWADADLIAPGPTTSSGLPDLWARDRKSGNLYQLLNKRNAAGIEDPTSLGDQTNATIVGNAGAYGYDTKTVLVSAGNPTVTGSQTYTYPALWTVAEPGGQLKLMQGTANGPAIDSASQAASWPSSTTSWTTATGATNVNGGAVTTSTGPVMLGVDQNTGTNLCMDLVGADPTPGNWVQGYTCNGTPAQLWTIGTDSTIRWGQATSTACLTVSTSPAPAQHGLPSSAGNYGANAGNWANSPIVIGTCPAAGTVPPGTQQWMFRTSTTAPQAGNGHSWYTVYNPASGMSLNNYNCDRAGGVQLSLYTTWDGACEQWQAPAAQNTWLQALGVGLDTQTTETATAPASTTTGQPTPNGMDYTLAATKVGDHYGVDWYIPYSGSYAIWAYVATGPGNGQVQVTVDQAAGNAPLPMSYDAYAPTAGWNQYMFGDVDLTAGMHSFTFTVVGKNASSNGYKIGLDTLFAGPDHSSGPHAALTTSGGTAAVPVLAPASITLNASQSWPGVSPLPANAYSFDFGDGTTVPGGAATTATHTYTTAGVFTATVTVTDNLGVTATTGRLVYVTAPPAGLTSSDGVNTAACATTSATAATMASLTPTLGATVGSSMSAQFELRDLTDPASGQPIVIGGTGSVGTRGPASTVVTPSLINGHEYAFAARSVDVAGNISPVSTTCYFWAIISGGQATPTGAVSLPMDNVAYLASSAQTWTGSASTLTWSNGNLVLTRNSDSVVQWASGTSGSGNILMLQNDGNIVVYSAQPTINSIGSVTGSAVWSAGTAGQGATALLLATDGSLTIRNGATVLWNAPIATHRWALNDKQGSTASDTGSPAGSPATFGTGSSPAPGGYGLFDGAAGYAATTSAAIDTTKSFTVAAWVYLNSPTGYQTFVTQQGNQSGGFHLQFENNGVNGNSWAFARATADTANPNVVHAESPANMPLPGVWTHLTGTWDAASGAMNLYVNGQLAGSAVDTSPIASTGPLVIGRGFFTGVANNFIGGGIADVRVYQQALGAPAAKSLYQNTGFTPPTSLTYSLATPTALTSKDSATSGCSTDPAHPAISTTQTPTLGATLADASWHADFEVRDYTDPSVTAPLYYGGTGASTAAGKSVGLATPSLINGHEYAFAARAANSNSAKSANTSTCYLRISVSGQAATAATGAVGAFLDNTVYPASAGPITWSGPLSNLVWQTDGNLMVYSKAGQAVWSSNTAGHPGASLALQSDGNLVIRTSTPLMDASGTLYGSTLWSSGTAGKNYDNLVVQAGGDVVLESNTGSTYTVSSSTSAGSFTLVAPSGVIASYRVQSDGNVWGTNQWVPGGSWAPWSQMTTNGGFTGIPQVVQASNGVLAIYVRRTDGTLWGASQQQTSGPFTGWGNINSGGGSIVTDPTIIRISSGLLAAYVTAADGNVWGTQQYVVGGSWAPWSQVTTGGGTVGKPSIVIVNDLISFFVRQSDGTIWGASQHQVAGAFTGWGNINGGGGSITSEPTIILTNSGVLAAYVTAADGNVWGTQQYVAGGSWAPWSQLSTSGGYTGNVQVLQTGTGLISLYFRTTNGDIYSAGQQTSGGAFLGWSNLNSGGVHFIGDPMAMVLASGIVAVYAPGADGKVYGTNQYVVGGNFTSWAVAGS